MSAHRFYDGSIYHKRFLPKEHEFKYKFYMLDIDLNNFDDLKNRWFSINKFNLFSFNTKDHFGEDSNFLNNVENLLNDLNIAKSNKMRFVTLPRVLNFVFNPISMLIIFDEHTNKAIYLLAEVHNYNGGRVIYPVKLEHKNHNTYKGEIEKSMYVSPFFKRDGDYNFTLKYDEKKVSLKIDLYEDNKRKLFAHFSADSISFTQNNIMKLFLKHTFLTFFVLTRTIIQAIQLSLKGIKFNSVEEIDTKRRH